MNICKCGCGEEVPYIKKRGHRPRKYIDGHFKRAEVNISKVKYLYQIQEMSMNEIADIMNTTRQTLAKKMEEHGIDRRKNIDAMRLKNEQSGRDHGPNWKGGSWYSKSADTWWTYVKHHPKRRHNGAVPTHILVAEERIGRHLDSNEVVHHLDENRSNNSNENLCVMSKSCHMRVHRILGKVGIKLLSSGDKSIIELIDDEKDRALIEEIYLFLKPIVEV